MTDRLVIGIAGALRSGKDTIGYRLSHGWGFYRLAFADALRGEIMARMSRTVRALHDLQPGHADCRAADVCAQYMLFVTKPQGFRELLQEYGSDVRRRDDPSYWTRQWKERVAGIEGPVVVTDVRFENEAEAVRSIGGKLWRITRPGHGGNGHLSEHGLDGWQHWDAEIENGGSIDDLWARVDGLVEGQHMRKVTSEVTQG